MRLKNTDAELMELMEAVQAQERARNVGRTPCHVCFIICLVAVVSDADV